MDGPPPGLYPRWLLRDKNGDPVRAIVEPHCGGDPEDCRVPDIGEPPDFRCVHVTMHEDRYVGLLFGVADGDPLDLQQRALAVSTEQPVLVAARAATAPSLITSPRSSTPTDPTPRARPSAAATSSSSSRATPIEPDQCFFVDIIDGCLPINGPIKPLFPILPIPAEFMTLLLDGAPYTLEAAYD
jgi:hypothetical protein